jgi:flavin-dependent dehydrogenase
VTESGLEQWTSDICVIGGGPGGAAAAIRLAQLGYSVTLIERLSATRRPIGESLAAPILSVLDDLRIRKKVESADFLWCDRTVSRWTGDAYARDDRSALMVDRSRFDRILLDSAADAGAVTLTGATAQRPIGSEDGWIIPVRAGTRSAMVKARLVVDASGRRAGRVASGAPTVALCGRWRGVPWSDTPEMRIEAGKHCWFWGAPMPDGSVTALVFLDPRWYSGGLGRRTRIASYRSLLGNSTLLGDCLRGTIVGEVLARNATFWMSDQPVSERHIAVGDALLAADPISSQGVHAAIRSGIQASIVVHTLLSGGDSAAAIEFYRGAQRQAAVHNSRLAGAIYASESLYCSSFWIARAAISSTPKPLPAASTLPRAPAVLRLSTAAQLVTTPVIDGDMVCRHRAVSHPSLDKPIVWLGGLALTPLLLSIGDGCSVETILSNWSCSIEPGAAKAVLAWLIRHRILQAAEECSPTDARE